MTVNHRLNALGFFDVSELGGPAYADSANVGMTDLVAALRWVRDDIANFGGDRLDDGISILLARSSDPVCPTPGISGNARTFDDKRHADLRVRCMPSLDVVFQTSLSVVGFACC